MSLSFDGTDDALLLGTNDDIFTENGAMTFYLKCNLTSDTSSGGTGIRFFERGMGGGDVLLQMFAPTTFDFNVSGVVALDVPTVSGAITLNTVSTVILTWDGGVNASGVHIYVNGIEAAYGTTTNMVAASDNSGGISVVGNRTSLNRGFTGTMYEVAIFNVVIGASSIALLSQNTVGSRRNQPFVLAESANLKRYFKLDEKTAGNANGAGTVTDYSSVGVSATGTFGPNAGGLFYSVDQAMYFPSQLNPSGMWGGR